MRMARLMALAAVALAATIALAPRMLSAQTLQPYAGLETRPVKALSDQQIADLKAGRGMGLALAAELNGYPGPTHVIEIAESLGLTEAQGAEMQALFESMKAETVPLGEKLIAQETDLDKRFADRTITDASLVAVTQAIGLTQAALRAAHLKYHLATIKVLTPTQIARYAELRGYASDAQGAKQHTGHQH
jgi:Spy/CpxP family protein refolding chaperone